MPSERKQKLIAELPAGHPEHALNLETPGFIFSFDHPPDDPVIPPPTHPLTAANLQRLQDQLALRPAQALDPKSKSA